MSIPSYSPEYLVQEDVVVVTINYRLGPLGFLYLPEAGCHGNAGLEDQVCSSSLWIVTWNSLEYLPGKLLAMKWVQENIHDFGGDPNNVTIFGESAGGASVHIHTLSKASKKYFHKAICQSGTALMEWAIQSQPERISRKIAEMAGCKATDAREILSNSCRSILMYSI